MNRVFAALLAALVLSAALNSAEIPPDRYLEHVKYLASDELKGRATGTTELEKAAGYIAKEFKKAGLQPLSGSWLMSTSPVPM